MLRKYVTKPSDVMACKITEKGKITRPEGVTTKKGTYIYKEKAGAITTLLEFEASKTPAVGDYIIFLSKEDIYHCPEDVFDKKYALEGFRIM